MNNEELQTLTTNEQTAFNAAHRQMMVVGYENVTQQEQCGIVEALLSDMNRMVYDDDDDEVCPMKPPSNSDSIINHPRDFTEQSSQRSYTSQHSEDEILAASGDNWPADLKNDVVPQVPSSHKNPYSLSTTADTLNVRLYEYFTR